MGTKSAAGSPFIVAPRGGNVNDSGITPTIV